MFQHTRIFLGSSPRHKSQSLAPWAHCLSLAFFSWSSLLTVPFREWSVSKDGQIFAYVAWSRRQMKNEDATKRTRWIEVVYCLNAPPHPTMSNNPLPRFFWRFLQQCPKNFRRNWGTKNSHTQTRTNTHTHTTVSTDLWFCCDKDKELAVRLPAHIQVHAFRKEKLVCIITHMPALTPCLISLATQCYDIQWAFLEGWSWEATALFANAAHYDIGREACLVKYSQKNGFENCGFLWTRRHSEVTITTVTLPTL